MNILKSPLDHDLKCGGIFHDSAEASYSSETRSTHSEEEVILASARPKKRAGRSVFKETRHPVYRGVRLRNKNKWVCEMRVPKNNSRIWLGTYPTPEMAARAHDVAALALRGKSACLNFADSVWRLRVPSSTDAVDIRRAAGEAAEAFAVAAGDDVDIEQQQSVMATNDDEVQEPMNQDEDQDLHDLLLSIANEPLMSPPPCARDGRDWNDVDIFHDDEVSLWNFSLWNFSI